jgi:hypothetical protein
VLRPEWDGRLDTLDDDCRCRFANALGNGSLLWRRHGAARRSGCRPEEIQARRAISGHESRVLRPGLVQDAHLRVTVQKESASTLPPALDAADSDPARAVVHALDSRLPRNGRR